MTCSALVTTWAIAPTIGIAAMAALALLWRPQNTSLRVYLAIFAGFHVVAACELAGPDTRSEDVLRRPWFPDRRSLDHPLW